MAGLRFQTSDFRLHTSDFRLSQCPQDPHPPEPQPPEPQPPEPQPDGLSQPPSLPQPPCATPFALGSSYRRQHFSRPHRPESFDGLRLKSCCLAILIETGSNDCRNVVQHSGRPHVPYPPYILASSRTPIWRISMRVRNSAASSRTSSRKSTRPSAVK